MKKLSKKQRIALEEVVSLEICDNFYLAGGTALLIRYGHRFSEDFDFFSFPQKSFDSFSLIRQIDKLSSVKWIYQSKDTLIFITQGIKFSFFEYHYPLLEEPEKDKELGIFIAKDKDIACMKAVAIAQRGSKKDFYDLWFLMKEHKWDLKELEKFVKKKYTNIEFSIIVKSLVYFE
ncbi:MAG: hypothetical protein DSY32_04845, partial [Aquifex sp.]